MDEVQRRGSPARMAYMKRFLSFILCAVLVVGLMEPPRAKAFAVSGSLAAAGCLAVIASVLVASGAQFADQDALLRVSQDIYDRYIKPSEKLAAELGVIVADWFLCRDKGISAAINVSARLWALICGNPVAQNVVSDRYGVPGNASVLTIDTYFDWIYTIKPIIESVDRCLVNGKELSAQIFDAKNVVLMYGGKVVYEYTVSKSVSHGSLSVFLTLLDPNSTSASSQEVLRFGAYWHIIPADSGMYSSASVPELLFTEPVTIQFYDLDVVLAGNVVRPGEKDRVIAMPDVFPRTDAETGTVEMPVLSLDQADYWVGTDVLTPAGTKEDTVVDASTGEAVREETGEGTDTKTDVGDIALEDIQAQEQALGAVFTSKFPFSIPWDVFKAVQLLAAPAEAPYWEVDFLAPMEHRVGSWKGDTTVIIDMGEYPVIGQVCRWASTFMFVWALMLGTKRLIWTA